MKLTLLRPVFATAAVLLFTVTACGGNGGTDGGGNGGGGGDDKKASGEIQLLDPEKLTVCTHLPYKPFQFQDESNEVVGFDVDLLQLLADDLGVEQEIVNVGEWGQVTSGAVFANDQCDIGMGAMTINDERAAALEISDPYFDATQVLAVPEGADYSELADMDGKTIGVQTDTTGESFANEQAEEFGYTTETFEDLALQVNALRAGNIDAAINDNGVVLDYIADNPGVAELATSFDTGEQYGFPAKKDDPNAKKLIERLNELLAEAETDGTYEEIHRKWFGVAPGEIGQ